MSHVGQESNYFTSQHPPGQILSTGGIGKKRSLCAMLCTDPSGTYLSHQKHHSAQVILSVTQSLQKNRIFTYFNVYSLGWQTRVNKTQVTFSHPTCIAMPWALTHRSPFLHSLAEFPQQTTECDHDRAPGILPGSLPAAAHRGHENPTNPWVLSSGAESPSVHQGRNFTACRSSPEWPQCEWHGEKSTSTPGCAAVAEASSCGLWD